MVDRSYSYLGQYDNQKDDSRYGSLVEDPSRPNCEPLVDATNASPPLVAVIDSGWAGEANDHRVRRMLRLSPSDQRFDDEGSAAVIANRDPLGHGTLVIGYLLSLTSKCEILPIGIFDASRDCTDAASLRAAIGVAIDVGVDIINVSLSTAYFRDAKVLYDQCLRAHRAGIVIVAASGSRASVGYPAGFMSVLGIRAARFACRYGLRVDDKDTREISAYAPLIRRGDGVYRPASLAAATVTAVLCDNVARGGKSADLAIRLLVDSNRSKCKGRHDMQGC